MFLAQDFLWNLLIIMITQYNCNLFLVVSSRLPPSRLSTKKKAFTATRTSSCLLGPSGWPEQAVGLLFMWSEPPEGPTFNQQDRKQGESLEVILVVNMPTLGYFVHIE